MHFIGLQHFYAIYFLLIGLSATQAHDRRHPDQARDIFSPIESLADSIFGITTTQNADQTTAAAFTTSPTSITQDDSTATATPELVTVVPTAAATSSSGQTSGSGTSSDVVSGSTIALTAQAGTTSSAPTTTSSSTSPSSTTTLPPTSPTPATPANPIQGLSSSSAGSPQAKQDNGNGVPAAGVAVAVVFGALILAGIAYLFYRHSRNSREKAAAQKSSRYNEVKRFSYLNHDEEQAMIQNPGLGLGKVASLKNALNMATSYSAQPYRARPRAGSEGTLVSEPTLTVSPLDRRQAPLPPLPHPAPESWPIISPIDEPYPPSRLVSRHATTATSTKARLGYMPYRPAVEQVIGLAVPLSSSHSHSPQKQGPPLPMSGQTYEVAAFEKAKRVSGVHELS